MFKSSFTKEQSSKEKQKQTEYSLDDVNNYGLLKKPTLSVILIKFKKYIRFIIPLITMSVFDWIEASQRLRPLDSLKVFFYRFSSDCKLVQL